MVSVPEGEEQLEKHSARFPDSRPIVETTSNKPHFTTQQARSVLVSETTSENQWHGHQTDLGCDLEKKLGTWRGLLGSWRGLLEVESKMRRVYPRLVSAEVFPLVVERPR